MNERFFFFVAFLLLVVASLVAAWVYSHLRARKLYGQSWETILARVIPLDRGKLRIVAQDLLGDSDWLDRQDGPCELDSAEIVELIGGLEGLRAIQKNCEALIDLACYCQRMYPEALVVAEELRRNAREIRWHLDRLDAATRNGSAGAALGEYAQRVVTIYYVMTRRVIALYEVAGMPGMAAVQMSFA